MSRAQRGDALRRRWRPPGHDTPEGARAADWRGALDLVPGHGRPGRQSARRSRAAAEGRRRRGGVVVIVGDAGIGKTRLGEEARSFASGLGHRRSPTGGRWPMGRPPFRPLSEALLAAFRATWTARRSPARRVPGTPRPVGPGVERRGDPRAVDTADRRVDRAPAARRRRRERAGCWSSRIFQWADADTLACHRVPRRHAAHREAVLCVLTIRVEGLIARRTRDDRPTAGRDERVRRAGPARSDDVGA